MTGRGSRAAAGEPASVQMAGVVTTIRDKCKRCYSCIRNCPAKAIRVAGGQAEVIEERCIGCGNCFKVCAQKAKEIRSARPRGPAALGGARPRLRLPGALIPRRLPLRPARPDRDCPAAPGLCPGAGGGLRRRVGGPRSMPGWPSMHPGRTIITTPCPAVVTYVEKVRPVPGPSPGAHRLAHGGAGPRRQAASTARAPASSSSAPASPRRTRWRTWCRTTPSTRS